jgi:hypothetical protein
MGDRTSIRHRYECRYGICYVDMLIYHIDMVILDVDMGYGLTIWEMTVSIWSSPISIWHILSLCSEPHTRSRRPST